MTKKSLSVDVITVDGGTQNRLRIDEHTVESYTDELVESNPDWPFPPLSIYHDGTSYFVSDGFHRLLAALRAKRGSVPCDIAKGTAEDAKIAGMSANDRHGLRMTQADKRACVEWLLDHRKSFTQKAIATLAGVSVRTVKTIVAERRKPWEPTKKGQIAPRDTNIVPATEESIQDTSRKGVATADDQETWVDVDDGTEPQETNSRRRGSAKAKPVAIPRDEWLRQYNESIKPVTKIVRDMARNLGESESYWHEEVTRSLVTASQDMKAWANNWPAPNPDDKDTIVPPKREWVAAYIIDQGYGFSVDEMFDYYEPRGWRPAKSTTKARTWKGLCRTFETNRKRWAKEKRDNGKVSGRVHDDSPLPTREK